ncbi:hypothetical protein SAMN05660841_00060 [Sphingobacterium nematocida]|uniref:Uncharacterized protein n=1 Tax=Sphingobacterium nematocida TaxID=1513896 RepID=A0A1T5APL7_9SPHI|nr:hypothetical protein [Sphingobacterium nematocida]SKB36876.1 hypothetical protein SAMN05660841_00060 [Sphingobacterium nematocida]
MEKLIFETNISTPQSAHLVQIALTQIRKIRHWKIDFESAYNLLIVEGIHLDHTEIISSLAVNGIAAERLYEE